jgi:hypothetical protein
MSREQNGRARFNFAVPLFSEVTGKIPPQLLRSSPKTAGSRRVTSLYVDT